MKMNKYKLSELAKDLKVTNNEVIECIEKYNGETKKTVSSLTPEEVTYTLEYFTQNNQVESFDDFYNNTTKPASVPETEKKAEKKKAETLIGKEEPCYWERSEQ